MEALLNKYRIKVNELYIETQRQLEDFIRAISDSEFITIDTEFLHEKTYYPQLCLIQIASENAMAIIDPLAQLDLDTLLPVLTKEDVLKVFHAGDQDRIILFQLLGTPVRPVFDLQRAVLLLGLSQQMSLVAIVRHYCDVYLKKAESFSDWSQRPLSEEQISYALDDVRYLPIVYRRVVEDLEDLGRISWLNEEFEAMEEESTYVVDYRETWKRLKGATSLKGQQLAIARELCSWRELSAQQRNLPRKWVLSDEMIVEICRRAPESEKDLCRIRGINNHINQRAMNEILAAVKTGKDEPEVRWPTSDRNPINDSGLSAKMDLMTALLHLRARESHISSSLLSNHDEMVRLAAGQREGLPVLSGWRRKLIGDELLQLLNGAIALSLRENDLEVTLLSQGDTESVEQ